MAKYAWSATHTTFSPNVCGGGVKTNVIPDVVNVEVDIRTVPGDTEDEVRRHLDKAVGGDLMDDVEIEKLFSKPASASPIGTPLWDVLGRVVDAHYPGARLMPRMIVGFTDAPYFREKGAIAYGFGLFSRALTAEAMAGPLPRQRRARRRGVPRADHAGLARGVRAVPRIGRGRARSRDPAHRLHRPALRRRR